MIQVRLLLFAVLRDIVGKDEESLMIPEGTRAADVWLRLRREHQLLSRYETPPLTAINESYASADTVLHNGDRLAFIPPVSGG